MTERAMPEEDLREDVSDVLARGVTYSEGFGEVNVADARAFVGKMTEAVLAVLRPHLVGVTEEQREALDHAIAIVREITIASPDGEEQADAEQTLSGLVSLRAIAGRGEAGTAEGE